MSHFSLEHKETSTMYCLKNCLTGKLFSHSTLSYKPDDYVGYSNKQILNEQIDNIVNYVKSKNTYKNTIRILNETLENIWLYSYESAQAELESLVYYQLMNDSVMPSWNYYKQDYAYSSIKQALNTPDFNLTLTIPNSELKLRRAIDIAYQRIGMGILSKYSQRIRIPHISLQCVMATLKFRKVKTPYLVEFENTPNNLAIIKTLTPVWPQISQNLCTSKRSKKGYPYESYLIVILQNKEDADLSKVTLEGNLTIHNLTGLLGKLKEYKLF